MEIEHIWQSSKRNLSYVSLALCLGEIFMFFSAAFLFSASEHHTLLAIRVALFTWLIGGVGSIVVAGKALGVDRHRKAAVISFVISILVFVVLGFSFLTV